MVKPIFYCLEFCAWKKILLLFQWIVHGLTSESKQVKKRVFNHVLKQFKVTSKQKTTALQLPLFVILIKNMYFGKIMLLIILKWPRGFTMKKRQTALSLMNTDKEKDGERKGGNGNNVLNDERYWQTHINLT